MVYSIIGDIVDSKQISEREKVQKHLEDVLMDINKKYNNVIIKEMSVTLGDEFQGVFDSFKYVFEIIHRIMILMKEIKIRFGVGIGDLKFDFGTKNNPYRSDGSAWWYSREATNEIRDLNEKNKIIEYSNIRILSGHTDNDSLVNTILDLCYAIRLGWTVKQKNLIYETILEYGFEDEFKYSNLAKKYDNSISTIHSKFKIANYSYYLKGLKQITAFFEKRCD